MKKYLLTRRSNLSLFCRAVYALIIILGLSGSANAQCIGPYQGFESFKVKGQTTGGLAALVGATAVPSIKADDAISGAIPIGFTFTYNGNNYTNVYASSNGFLSFNSAATSSPTNNLTSPAASLLPLLAPLWDDLDGTTATAAASYLTTGVAGSRIFTFEWLNWEWGAAANTPVISFQVKLYEANGRVEFIYRNDAGAVNTTSGGASVGVTGNVAGDFLSLANLSTTIVTSKLVETSNITAKPAGNITFGFVDTLVGDGWDFTASATVVSNAASARTGISFISLSSTNQSITTPLLINANRIQFYYRAASATSTSFSVLSSADPTFSTGVTTTNFTATSTTYVSTGIINIPAPNSYVRISRPALGGVALFIDDLSWTSGTATDNTIIVPETGNTICGDNSPTPPINVPDATSGRSLTFYDQGGASDVYNRLQSQTLYFAPSTTGDKVQLTLLSLGLDNILTGAPTRSTTVTIYSGTTLTAPNILATLTSATIASGQNYTSIAANGYITVVIAIYDGGTVFSGVNTTTGFQFNVKCVAVPTITGLSASEGCPGSTMTITGTNLSGATSVTIGATAVSSIGTNTSTSLTVTPAVGSSGTITVVNPGGTVTSVGTYSVNAIPTISIQPSSGIQTLCVGDSASPFSVTAAAGSGNIATYQWYSNTSASTTGATLVATNTSSATTDTYTPLTNFAGTLFYYVVVTNSNGCSVTSAFSGGITVNASVVITTPPSITTQTVCVGESITALSVVATGGGLSYQWFSNSANNNVTGSLIGGAELSTYTPPNTSAMATTYYYCVVSNGAPCNSSVPSAVSGGILVNPLPTAVTVSTAGTYCTNTTLTATNGGSGTIYYQGTTSGGTSTSTLATSQSVTASGTYYFRARSASGCWGPEGSATVTILSVPVAPVAAAATAVGTSGFTANWGAAAGATGYSLDVSTVNTFASFVGVYNNLTLGNVLTTAVTGLNPGTTYYYRVRASNTCGTSASSTTITVPTNPVTYCIPTGTNQDPNGITNVTLGTINNTTGLEANSYGNYSSLSTNVFIGSTVPFSITYRTGFTYNTYIWVDWNNDGDFTDVNERVYVGNSTNAVPTTLSGTFDVPLFNSNLASTLGSHRLRIGGVDFDDPSDPCRNGAWQAYEDYTINVVSVPPCAVSTPSALTTVNVTGTGATLVWSDPAMTPNTVYNYWVSDSNTPPAATCANPVGMGTVTGALSANVTGLTLGVQYYFWVRVKCDATTCSPWIGSATFLTANLDVVNMTDGSITTCNASFYDSGGFAGNYTNDEDFTYTFIPASGTNLKVVFNSFSLERNFDFLSIYDGPDTASPLLGTFTGAQILAGQTFFSSTANGGRLTFRFTSDFSVTPAGWDASISCVSVPIITSFDPTFTCAGSTPAPVVTINGSNFNEATSVSFNGAVVPITAANITGSGTIITVTLPAAATSGLISVSNAQATGSSTTPFTVRPIPATPTASADVAICNGQSTTLNAVVPPIDNALATTQVGGNSCGGGNMFDIVTGSNPIRVTSFDITPEIFGAQNVNVYYRVGTYLGNETNAGAWILLGTYPINGPGRVLLNMPVAALNLLPSTTYGIYINFDASYTNGTNTYSNSDLTINTGAGLCSAFGGLTATRTFNGVVRYQVNGTPSYTWTPSISLNSASIANPLASPPSTTTYSVTNTINGCTSLPDNVEVTVNPKPVPTITTPSATICANSVIPLTVSGTASTFTWTSTVANTLFTNATASTPYVPGSNTTTIFVRTPTTAIITVTATNTPSGCSETATVTFTVSTRNWNGAIWTNPSGPPLLNNGTENLVFLAGTFNSTGNLSACSCTVNGSNVTFNAGHTLSLVNGLTVSSGSMTFNDGASLVQTNNVANTGNITYKRNALIKKLDYVYWSSPVNNYTVNNITTALLPFSAIYKWNTTVLNGNTSQGNWQSANGDIMIKGKGYIARAPNSFPTTATTFNGTFIGVPNNGDIPMPIQRGSIETDFTTPAPDLKPITKFMDNWNLIGNPYPSAINAINFLTANTNIEGFINLWTHQTTPSNGNSNPFYGSFAFNYANEYITYNASGSSTPLGFSGNIAAGQGFFVNMKDGPATSSAVVFTNAMRNGNNSQFYRTATSEEERHRVWLQLVDQNDVAVPTLLCYAPQATLGLDRLYDAIKINRNTMNIYSLIDNQMFEIQGRPAPFDANDQVPLGLSMTQEGEYKIAIGAVDGLFEQGHAIYLEDKLLNTIHDLRQTPYSFSSEAGTVNDRFVLRYTNETLGVPTFSENTVVVYKNKAALHINSSNIPMRSVAIFDVTGRLIEVQNKINSTQTSFTNLPSTNQVLLVQITAENGLVVSKKIVY